MYDATNFLNTNDITIITFFHKNNVLLVEQVLRARTSDKTYTLFFEKLFFSFYLNKISYLRLCNVFYHARKGLLTFVRVYDSFPSSLNGE